MSQPTLEQRQWLEANRAYIAAVIDEIRVQIGGQLGRGETREEVRRQMGEPPAIEVLAQRFSLDEFEVRVLLLCAAVELDKGVAEACPSGASFGLALRLLEHMPWSAVSPGGALRTWDLVRMSDKEPVLSARLRIDERILHYLLGIDCLDMRLARIMERCTMPLQMPASYAPPLERICRLWESAEEFPIIELHGPDPRARRALAAAAGAKLRMHVHALAAADLPVSREQADLVRLWEREAVLGAGALLIETDESEAVEMEAARAFANRLRSPVAISSREPASGYRRPFARIEIGRPTVAEQEALWHRALGSRAAIFNGAVSRVVNQFDLGMNAIENSAREVLSREAHLAGNSNLLWEISRERARPKLDQLAARISARPEWDDLVLPESQMQLLGDIATHVRQRVQVYERWGFSARETRGLGISCLFTGPSGTGKTMAAEVLARELDLDLYRVDFSAVVSKYIGETEKNLRRVFDAAEEGGVILLFDEADALFGKRSEVKDSHDRYANLEVSYLLQRMESYRGLAILTTNLKAAIDPAFLRRLRFIVSFPFPDADLRKCIWQRVFPKTAPLGSLDYEKLARLDLSGGHIRNIALGAAFFAAEKGEPVRMNHLLRAVRGEYAKLERTLTQSEVEGWIAPGGGS